MSKSFTPSVSVVLARMAVVAVVAGTASACGDSKPVGSVGYITGFGGLAAGDEPRSVLVARDVLSAGGNAADAATALYFTMAVTQPSTAGLGGGGVCLVHDRAKKITEAVDFIARPAAGAEQDPRSAVGVPGSIRGFYALHAKFGSMRWESLLMEGEKLARLGVPVSRSLAGDLAMGARLLASDPASARVFFPDNRLVGEGQVFEQHDLASLYGRIRRAPGDFYTGGYAQSVVEAARKVGARLQLSDLQAMRPAFTPTATFKLGNEEVHVAPPPAVAGFAGARIAAALTDKWAAASADERPHLLAEAAARVFAERASWMNADGSLKGVQPDLNKSADLMAGYDPVRHQPVQAERANDPIPAASFVVMDYKGNGVACTVTGYGLFGIGRMLPGFGIYLPAAAGVNAGAPALGPVMVVNPHVRELRFAAASDGGVTAPTALAQVLLNNQTADIALDKAMAAPRVHSSGNPDMVFIEPEAGKPVEESLAKRGHQVKATAIPARVNAFVCATGDPSFKKCAVQTDPRSAGLSVVVGKD